MSIDPKIQEAIEAAVAEAGQPDGLARKLVRWFEAITSGNEDINNTQAANRHLELLYEDAQTVPRDKVEEELLAESLSEGEPA